MNNENIINCPECGAALDIDNVLFHQLEEKAKKSLQGEYNAKIKDLKNSLEEKFDQKEEKLKVREKDFLHKMEKLESDQENYIVTLNATVKDETAKAQIQMEKQIKKDLEEEQSERIKIMQNDLKKKSEQVKDLHRAKAEIEKIKLEKSELKDKIKLELNREMAQKINKVKERIIKNESEKVELNLIEKEKLIEQLRNDLKETQRRAEQGSVQAQGEAQEIGIEDYLKDTFPMDSIEEIKKGARGADCLQIINTPGREACGSIYYESKRTKKFGGDWVEKFRNDMREKGGVSVGILVTEAMPNDMPKMGMRNGIWICNYTEFKGLSIALRESVIQLSSAVVSQENKGGKMTMVYDYLISNEFKMIIESIVEAYSDMKSDLEREKRSLQGHWKRREKQIERVSVNVIDMYSSLKGLAGNSVQSVDALDYENMESEVYELEEKLEIKTSVN